MSAKTVEELIVFLKEMIQRWESKRENLRQKYEKETETDKLILLGDDIRVLDSHIAKNEAWIERLEAEENLRQQ